jgi:hypothetical protein
MTTPPPPPTRISLPALGAFITWHIITTARRFMAGS